MLQRFRYIDSFAVQSCINCQYVNYYIITVHKLCTKPAQYAHRLNSLFGGFISISPISLYHGVYGLF